MPKAAQQPEPLAQLALPVMQVRKAPSERRAHKAAPRLAWLAPLALLAKQARKAQSERWAHKAPLGW